MPVLIGIKRVVPCPVGAVHIMVATVAVPALRMRCKRLTGTMSNMSGTGQTRHADVLFVGGAAGGGGVVDILWGDHVGGLICGHIAPDFAVQLAHQDGGCKAPAVIVDVFFAGLSGLPDVEAQFVAAINQHDFEKTIAMLI